MASSSIKAQTEFQAPASFWSTDSRSRTALLAAVLVVATAAVYAPVHNHPWFNLDDYLDVVDNVHIHHGLDWETIKWSFTVFNMANWMPMSWMSHAVDWSLFGPEPAGHHDMNVLFHALDAVLLMWVLKRATGYTGRSFMVAALFALHPMNVEVVAWIAERKTLLSMTFFLLALGAYRWYAEKPRENNRYTVVALLFALGLAAKPQVITLPFVFLLWDYWPLQRMFPNAPSSSRSVGDYPQLSFSTLLREKLPLLYLCAADAIFTLYAQTSARPGLMPSLTSRLKNAVFSYVMYVKKCFWPSGMAPELPHRGASLTAWQVLGCIVLLSAITALVVVFRRHRYLPVGWFWFLGVMVPMIGIVQVGRQGMADRYVYQPFLGLFIIVCWGVSDWAAQHQISVRWLAAASAVILVALTLVTHRQLGYWKDNMTLWTHAVEAVPNHWGAETNVGLELMHEGKTAEAMQRFYRVIALNPDDGGSNMYIGYEKQTQGHPEEAIEHYRRALGDYTMPDNFRALIWKNMAVAYSSLGDRTNAQAALAKSAEYASKKKPD
ncbi:MAG: tetratricopeptide repeat protein [Candidatus Korobacteraceae bacterium]